MPCPDQPAYRTRKLRYNAFNELQSASSSALEALEALAGLQAGINEEPPHRQDQGLSFSQLKKRCLQLGVQAHKCTRLLAMIRGKDDLALHSVLSKQLQQLSQLLEGESQLGDEDLFQRLAPGWQGAIGEYFQQNTFSPVLLDQEKDYPALIISRTAGRYFFHTAGLFPRINHSLQQLDSRSWSSLIAVSCKIRQLIMACPLPADMQASLNRELQTLSVLQKTRGISLIPCVHSEDGYRSSFAGLIPTVTQTNPQRTETAEEAYKQILASLYSPQCLAYMEARGLRHEGTEISVLCVPEGAILAVQCNGRQEAADISSKPPLIAADTAGTMNQQQQPFGAVTLLKGWPASDGIAAGKIHLIRSPADSDTLPKHSVAVVSKASMDWVLLLPRVAALIIEGIEEEFEACRSHPLLCLAREFALPLICCLKDSTSVFHDGMPVTVDAHRGAVYAGIITALAEKSIPKPRNTLGSPAEMTLAALGQLFGVDHAAAPDFRLPQLTAAHASCCTTMLDIVFWCRFKAVEALLCQNAHRDILPLASSLQFSLYDIEELLPAGSAEEVLTIEDIEAPLLQVLWRSMAQRAVPAPGRITTADTSALKNSVLLARKYCTLQFTGINLCLHLAVEEGRHGQNFRLIFLLEDSRPDSANRLPLLANQLSSHGLRVQAAGTGLRAVITKKARPHFEQALQFVGALTVQALG